MTSAKPSDHKGPDLANVPPWVRIAQEFLLGLLHGGPKQLHSLSITSKLAASLRELFLLEWDRCSSE